MAQTKQTIFCSIEGSPNPHCYGHGGDCNQSADTPCYCNQVGILNEISVGDEAVDRFVAEEQIIEVIDNRIEVKLQGGIVEEMWV